MKNLKYAADLRELAEFFESHPEMPVNGNWPIMVHTGIRSEFVAGVKALSEHGKVTKSTDDDRYPSIAAHHAKGKFGDIILDMDIPKSLVCRKVRKMVEADVRECPDSLLEPEEAADAEDEQGAAGRVPKSHRLDAGPDSWTDLGSDPKEPR